MGRHPSAEQIRRFLDHQGPRCSQSTALHLLQCQECRHDVIDKLEEGGGAGHPLARVLRHPSGWQAPAPAAGTSRLLDRLNQAASEVAAGPALLVELRRRPLERWSLLFRNSKRFHSLALAREILHAGHQHAYDDPPAGARMVRAGFDLIDLLDPERYGERLLDDLRARGWALMGDCYRRAGDLKTAEAAMRRAGRLVRDTADPEELATYKYLLGVLSKDQRRYERALKLFEQARRLSEEIGDRVKLAKVLTSSGLLRMDRGEPELALPLLLDASALLDDVEDKRLALFVPLNLANCLADLGDYAGALEAFQGCRDRSAASTESYVRLRARWIEGRITAGLGDSDRAEDLLFGARAEYVERGQIYNAALISLDLAALYARQGRSAELKALAEEMAAVFVAQDVPAEAIAALAFFRQAVEQERATEELVGGVARFLQRAQTEPGIRFHTAGRRAAN